MRASELYEECADLGLTENKQDFSQRWLARSPNYLTSLEAQNLDLSSDALGQLYIRLIEFREYLEASDTIALSDWRAETLCQISKLCEEVQEALRARWSRKAGR